MLRVVGGSVCAHVVVPSLLLRVCDDDAMLHGMMTGIATGACGAECAEAVLENVSTHTAAWALSHVVRAVEQDERLLWCDNDVQNIRLRSALDGRITDLLCDSVRLTHAERANTWGAQRALRAAARAAHAHDAHTMAVTAESRTRMRASNHRAFEELRAKSDGGDIVMQPLDWLAARPPVYWNSVSLASMTEIRRRATVHRVEELLRVHGRAATTSAFRVACEEEATRLAALRESPRRRRARWYLMCHMVTRVRSMLRTRSRGAHTTRRIAVPSDSSAVRERVAAREGHPRCHVAPRTTVCKRARWLQ